LLDMQRLHAALLLPFAAVAAASTGAVGRYAGHLAKVQSSKGHASLASLYADAEAASDELAHQIEDRDGAPATGTPLPEPTQPPGLLVSWQEALFAVPDPEFFSTLAKEHGTAADVAFFDLLSKSYDGAWPAWTEQQTDVTGCDRLEAPAVVDLYRLASTEHKEWSQTYRDHQTKIRAEIEGTLTDSTCACGQEPEVRANLEAFLAAFPKSPAAPKLRDRLKTLHDSHIRFGCQSG
jgi:hypothetical protein